MYSRMFPIERPKPSPLDMAPTWQAARVVALQATLNDKVCRPVVSWATWRREKHVLIKKSNTNLLSPKKETTYEVLSDLKL